MASVLNGREDDRRSASTRIVWAFSVQKQEQILASESTIPYLCRTIYSLEHVDCMSLLGPEALACTISAILSLT
jgi:hypothetical protein